MRLLFTPDDERESSMAPPKILWRLVMEATIDTLRGRSRGQYDIRLGRPERLAEFFSGVPRTAITPLGGFTLTIPLESYGGPDPLPGETVHVRYMGELSRRRDWYIASQRPTTAYPLWRLGRGLRNETEPNTDYVVVVRDPEERFHGRWIAPSDLARLPDSLRDKLRTADSGWDELSDDEWTAVQNVLEITDVPAPALGSLVPTEPEEGRLRDELLLLVDAYLQEGGSPSGEIVEEMVDQVGRLASLGGVGGGERSTPVETVFAKLDEIAEDGSGGDGLAEDSVEGVFSEFAERPEELHAVTEAIRANLDTADAETIDAGDQGITMAPEGRVLSTVHLRRERNRGLRASKIRAAGLRPTCETCGFDFEEAYGERGRGFIECHHTVPLVELRPGSLTSLDDLTLLCANCHRMIHVARPWLTVDELRAVIQAR